MLVLHTIIQGLDLRHDSRSSSSDKNGRFIDMRSLPPGSPASRIPVALLLLSTVTWIAGCAAPPDGRLPETAWQCPDGTVDLSRNEPVPDARRAHAGEGVAVRGLNGWEGEISGVPGADSRFRSLLIGMRPSEVAARIGAPGDYGVFVTQRDSVARLFGSDSYRYEMTYRGSGRLVFTTRSGFGPGHYLTWIIHESSRAGAAASAAIPLPASGTAAAGCTACVRPVAAGGAQRESRPACITPT